MTRPFALTVQATTEIGYDIAERLGFDDMQDALAVSVFETEGGLSVQALYSTRGEAEAAQRALANGFPFEIAQMPDTDWVAVTQAGLPPIEAGRFVVHGSHDSPDTSDRMAILVDAGAAFGTGHHGTTAECLHMLSDLPAPPKTILDLGTGAGVLAIAAAKLFPEASILATDIDPDAVAVAKANAELNGVRFACLQADGFDTPALEGRQFDIVIANILAGPLREMASDVASAMASGGTAILSGILDEQADWVAERFAAQGLRLQKRPSRDGWTSLFAYRD